MLAVCFIPYKNAPLNTAESNYGIHPGEDDEEYDHQYLVYSIL